ncbi:MFS transporter [Vallicoccus soli]|uniref:MFS transporter n=1 Tax=Vallicoccus soli TaxID=2339232 RepID=A0A3A3Z2A2_9ACTN|nr:MFS transporter [Vallicoccus soli]
MPREVAVLAAVAFAVALGFGVVAPAIPLFAREFGVGRTAAGAVVSAFAAMRLASALLGGRLVDRYGERLVLATGIGIVAVSSLLAGLAQSYAQLLVLRGVGGVGSAMFTVSAVSLVLRVVGPDQRARAMGVYQGGFILGGIAGPAFGGALAGGSLRAPFFVYAATLAAAGAIGMVFLRAAHLGEAPAQGTAAPERTTLRQSLGLASYRAALVTNLGVGWVLLGLRASLLPLFVVEGLGRDPFWTGVGLVVSALGQAALLLPAGRVADTVGRRPAMLLGGVLAVGSTATLALSTSVVAYVLAMVAFGAGFAFLGTAPAAVVGDVAPGRGGTSVAAFQMASDLGAVVGPVLAGALADSVSYGAAWGASAGVLAAGLLLTAVMPETRRAAPAGPVAGHRPG